MISLDTATKLKTAGLVWAPKLHDFFFIPFQDLDERVFVVSDMSILLEKMGSKDAITFNGTAEWAMDYLIVGDAVWVPTEEQLRQELEQRLVARGETQPVMTLQVTSDGYKCTIQYDGQAVSFEAFGASEAYGAALLHVMGNV